MRFLQNFFIIMNGLQWTKNHIDVIPESKSVINSVFSYKNKLFIGKNDGHFTILNHFNQRLNSFVFPSPIHNIVAADNCLLLQMRPTIKEFFQTSWIYFHTDSMKKKKFHLKWSNDTSIYENIHPLEKYYIRINPISQVRIADLENQIVRFFQLPCTFIEKAYLYFDHLFVITDDHELLIFYIDNNREIILKHRLNLLLEKSIVKYLTVTKQGGLLTVIIHMHKIGIYIYYFTAQEEENIKPVFQCFYQITSDIQALTLSLPFLFLLVNRHLIIIKLSGHTDRKYKDPEEIHRIFLGDEFDSCDQMIYDRNRIIMNGDRYLRYLTSDVPIFGKDD